MERRLIPSEAQEQIALYKWCNLKGYPLVHIPNEGKRTAKNGRFLLMQGMQPGFPDNVILFEAMVARPLFIELKQNREYRPSEMRTPSWQRQEQWLVRLRELGYGAMRCYGWEDAVKGIERYLGEVRYRKQLLESKA
jgi:VRR-NUC domain.